MIISRQREAPVNTHGRFLLFGIIVSSFVSEINAVSYSIALLPLVCKPPP